MNVGDDLFDLVREEEREEEAKRHAHERGHGVGRQELPERDAGDPGREEGRSPQPHHVSRREDDLDAVAPVAGLELFLTGGAQDPTDGTPAEDPLPPVVSDPIEGNVARKHPCDANRQRDPPSQNELVRQDPAGHDWQLLGDGDPEAGEE